MAIMPQMKLSSFPQVVAVSRISKSGNPIAATGDLEGRSDAINLDGSANMTIVIDSVSI